MDKITKVFTRANNKYWGANLGRMIRFAHQHSDKDLKITIEEAGDKEIGKWGMSRMWRSWMSASANHMAANGALMPLMIKANGEWYGKRKFNSQDAHELFTSKWLGVDEKGARLSWAKQPEDGEVIADKGERFIACLKHEEWMTDKGIKFLIPRDSEFFKEKEGSES